MPSATFTASGTWTVPLTADPASVQVYAQGEGGNSGTSVGSAHSGAGGGGGAIGGEPALGGLHVGSVLSFTIGAGGTGIATVVTGGSVAVTGAAGTNGSGITIGLGGAAGANTVAFAGGNGGAGASAVSRSGGAGGGSAGSTSAGGTGASSTGSGATAGGAAGTGAAGPPSLAGAAGAGGGSSTQAGNNGIAPGSGAGGPGDSATHPATTGAAGQVIIIWNTLNGVGLPAALVSVTAFTLTPSPSNLKVTATAGGSAANGILLRVRVLDNAAFPTPVNSGTTTSSASQAANQALTPGATGSQAYAAVALPIGTTPATAAGNTALDAVGGHGTYVSTATLTANTPFTAGSTTQAIGSAAAVEVTPFGGAIAVNGTSPASVNNTGGTTATTAAFAPPTGGRLLLALVSAEGGTGQVAMAVSDSLGLTWVKAVEANAAGDHYAGIWYAYSPANLSVATTGNLSAGTAGTAYSSALTAAGGYGNYGWTLATGSLPAGLSLNGATGVISGTPSTPGLSTFTVTVGDGFGNTATSGILAIIVNQGVTGSGFIRQGWTAAAGQYSYGTLQVPVATTENDWIFVSVSWVDGEDNGIAYCADSAHNYYEPVPGGFAAGAVNTQVFVVPDARAASTVYVSTSAYVRWLTVLVLDVTGLQAGYVLDAANGFSGGPALSFTENLSTVQPDFILSVGAFQGTPQTVTQAGGGPAWTALTWAGINGNASDGITQSAAWASTAGAASPSMQYTATSPGSYSGCMVAVRKAGGLPVNPNPAWPVISCQAAFGYSPQEPAAPAVWTDITPRFLGLSGQRGRSFELDELRAADVTLKLDNFDGALSPGNPGPYYPNVTLITPVQLTATWQGRTSVIFRGIITAIPQTYDFQRGMVEATLTDDWSKMAQALLPACMIQEAVYDKPLHLWPLNEQQGATSASNWSGRSAVALTPTPGVPTPGTGGGVVPSTQQVITIFGHTFPVPTVTTKTLPYPFGPFTSTSKGSKPGTAAPGPAPIPTVPVTGFGNSLTGAYPAALMGAADSVWGNTTAATNSSYYQGTTLVDSNDIALPLTATGATFSVWAQMYYVPSNTSAVILALTDLAGTAGKNYLTLSYDGTHVTVTQTAGSTTFTPPAFLFDSKWHLWTVTVSTGGTITVYLDGAVLGSLGGTFPSGSPVMLQWGGDSTASTASAAGIFTGCMFLAGAYDRVVDTERIVSWFQSGSTGFLDELAGTRIQRILAWARWNAPQAVDPGLTMQQQFNYITSGYGNNGLTGAIGHANTAGASTAVSQGAQADVTIQDIANTDNGFLAVRSDGTAGFTERDRISNFPVGIALGDVDYALNTWQQFEAGLGPWTSVSNCTVARSAGWSYAGHHSALVTVTGTPVTAYAWGDKANVAPSGTAGFSCWVMSPQGCSVRADVDWYTPANVFISTSSGGTVNVPPMTPVFLNLTGLAVPGTAGFAYPHPTLVSSPATGTQLYFDHVRLSPAGFQVPYGDDVQITEDIQYLYNVIDVTRNVDQAGYRAMDLASRGRFYPRFYTRTIFSSVDDATAVQNCGSTLLASFAQPALRVPHLVIDAAENPEAWPFVLSADIGDSVSFTRTPVGGATVAGTFTVLGVGLDIAKDKAQFTYALAPRGVF